MPTVPPTFISLDGDDDLIRHAYTVSDDGDTSLSGPTPDPDLDEGILVPVVTGDGVGAVTSVGAHGAFGRVERVGADCEWHRARLLVPGLLSPDSA